MGHGRLELRDEGQDLFDRFDHIRTRLLVDEEQHSGLTRQRPVVPDVLDRVNDIGHIFQFQNKTIRAFQNQILIVLCRFGLVVGLDLPSVVRTFNDPFRSVSVEGHDRRSDLIGTQTHCIEFGGVELNANRR